MLSIGTNINLLDDLQWLTCALAEKNWFTGPTANVFVGVTKNGPPNDSGVLGKPDAQTLCSNFPTLKSTLLYSKTQFLIGLLVIPKWLTFNDLYTSYRCLVLALAPDASTSKMLLCLAYWCINIPLATYCKTRYGRNRQQHHAVVPRLSCY